MSDRSTSQQFLELLAARDFAGLAATMTAGAQARMLLPRGLEEHSGGDAIARRVESWFGAASAFDLRSSTDEQVGARRRLSWRFDVVRDGGAPEVVEQVAFMDVGPRGIERIDLVCSGFQREPGREAQVFDAGDLGCADGLAREFRHRLAGVPVGSSLRVVVRDPAAREDLPSLARLLGQRVASEETADDGRLVITVERLR